MLRFRHREHTFLSRERVSDCWIISSAFPKSARFGRNVDEESPSVCIGCSGRENSALWDGCTDFSAIGVHRLATPNDHAEAEDLLWVRGGDRHRRQASNETLSPICYKRAG